MSTFLFDKIIFGPVQSRRLGNSLGINLLPLNRKICNFDCLYCECGMNGELGDKQSKLPGREEVREELRAFLALAPERGIAVDTITFAGNGEPTMHPAFAEIIEDTVALRNSMLPTAKIAVLSNATLIGKDEIRKALQKIDLNILKLDSAIEDTVKKINCPGGDFSLSRLQNELKKFSKGLIIQTLFVRGQFQQYNFDNTTDEEIEAWLTFLRTINPESVMIYSIARDTPIDSIEKISGNKLREIAGKVKKLGIPVSVSD